MIIGLHKPYRTNVGIVFARDVDGWTWTLHPDRRGNSLVFKSRPEDEVRQASDQLKAALVTLCGVVEQWATISQAAKEEHKRHIVDCGRALGAALFDGQQAEFASELQHAGFPSISQIGPRSQEQHQIELSVLPFDSGECFLGERCLSVYRFSHRPEQALKAEFGLASINLAQARDVGYAEDDLLNSACKNHRQPTRPDEEEIYVVAKLTTGISALSVLEPLTCNMPSEDIKYLREWLASRRSVLHFNCHAQPAGSSGEIHLRVRRAALIGPAEMRGKHAHDFSGTLVFLNTCNSGIGSYSFKQSLTDFFRAENAPCVICTTGPIETKFGTMFAKELYENLAGRKLPIPKALLQTRGSLIRRTGHPMALLYTYVGQDGFVLS